MNILNEFTKERLTSHMAHYEMYYQVALGNLISQTHANEMSFDIDFQQALGSMYELFSDLSHFEDIEPMIEKEIQKQAAIDAVQNFVNEHLELVKEKKFELEPIINAINDGRFFNTAMIEICQQQSQQQLLAWEGIISDELCEQIIDSIRQLEQQ